MKRITIPMLALILAGCTHEKNALIEQGNYKIDRGNYTVDSRITSANANERIRFLVMHYTAVDDKESLRLLTQPDGGASAHYLVPSVPAVDGGKPVVLGLVPEEKRAWHAGVSHWAQRDNLNDTSIGIEIVNLGFTEGLTGKHWYPYTPEQIELVARMAQDIATRYGISPDNILAHSDIAPQRKHDPGPLFPWEMLAKRGIGAWPSKEAVVKYLAGRDPAATASVKVIQAALAKYGYQIPQNGELDEETRKVLIAFQMHFRPSDISGSADAQTEALALALVEKYRQ